MHDETGYVVATLRYYPDLVRQEFVNVAVALVCPETGYWSVRVAGKRKLRALRELYPSAQTDALAPALIGIKNAAAATASVARAPVSWNDPLGVVRAAIGSVLGTLKWGEPSIQGVTTDAEAALDRWFNAMVSLTPAEHAAPALKMAPRPSANAIMRHVLEARGVWNRLRPAKIEAYTEERFEHTYRNGRLHIFQPIDLTGSEKKILATAQQWRGRIDSISDQPSEPFSFFPLIELPKDPKLEHAAHAGVEMIRRARAEELEAFTTEEADAFAARAEEVMGRPH